MCVFCSYFSAIMVLRQQAKAARYIRERLAGAWDYENGRSRQGGNAATGSVVVRVFAC